MSTYRIRHKKLIPVVRPGEGAYKIEGLSRSVRTQGRCELPKARVSVAPIRLGTHLAQGHCPPLSDRGSVKARNKYAFPRKCWVWGLPDCVCQELGGDFTESYPSGH